MHELAITQNIVAIAMEYAGERPVQKVTLEIGKLSLIVPDAIEFCFDACIKGTLLEGAELEINLIDGAGRCTECGAEMPLFVLLGGTCSCGSSKVECIQGQELRVKELEVL